SSFKYPLSDSYDYFKKGGSFSEIHIGLAEFSRPRREKPLKIIFSRDMCTGENTSHPASVNSAAVCAAELCAQQGAIIGFKRLCLLKPINKTRCLWSSWP